MDIIEKVFNVEGDKMENINFSNLVGPLHFFDNDSGLGSNWRGYHSEKDAEHNVKFYVNRQMDSKGYGWIKKSDIPKNVESLSLHKIYMPKAGGTGNDEQIIGVPFYGEPNSVCSFTYICLCYDPKEHNYSQAECFAIVKYMKSRFFRYLVSIKKKTQNTSRYVFALVPMQDFTTQSDIDWSKSIPEIDQQLYTKYNLSDDEINFIEKMIKPME
jgi:hypothetical protein